MKTQCCWILILALLLFTGPLLPQSSRALPSQVRNAGAGQEEIVSFNGATSFRSAMQILSDLSLRYLNKIIIDPDDRITAIGIDIDQLHWLTALELILKKNGLWYREYEDYIKIIAIDAKSEASPEKRSASEEIYHAREVIISAVFFEADISRLRQAGMSWSFFRGSDVNLDASASAADNQGGLFELSVDPNLSFGDISAAFKALESDQFGEVVASPTVTVGSDKEGRIQVGSDIAVTLQDFAGNAVTQFFSTGSIIKVYPKVIHYNDLDFIHLRMEIERSSSSSGDVGLEIQKSSATTTLNLLDGEETIIGGLYVTEETSTREGVPFLKDLPWWMLGIRYLFGFESKNWIKKELLILIKAELLPSLEERYEAKTPQQDSADMLQKYRDKLNQRMRNYQDKMDQQN